MGGVDRCVGGSVDLAAFLCRAGGGSSCIGPRQLARVSEFCTVELRYAAIRQADTWVASHNLIAVYRLRDQF